MLDFHIIAVGRLVGCGNYGSACRGKNWSARGSRIVGTQVRLPALLHGVKAIHGVARGNAGKFEGSLEEHSLHALAFLVVVALDRCVLVLVLKSIKGLAVVKESGCQNFTRAHKYAVVDVGFLVNNLKAVADLNSKEVNSPGINFGKLHGNGWRHALLL